MPTLFTHPVIPIALGASLGKEVISRQLVVIAVLLSVLPDLDVIAFSFGIPYSSQFGHRGFTHSLFLAVLVCLFLVWLLPNRIQLNKAKSFVFLFSAMGSHGLLDMLTDGGLGIALFWPFTNERYFFLGYQYVKVSPLGMDFFSEWGMNTLISELVWIWLPTTLIAATVFLIVRRFVRS